METETMEKNFGLTHSKIIKLLTPYLTVYPACKLEASGLMLYARALQDVPLDEIDAAMVKLMRTSKFFPSVAEILEAVKTTRDVIGVLPMLAKVYEYRADKVTFPVAVQPKLDGHRCIAVIELNKTVLPLGSASISLWSRTRKRIRSMPHIEAEIGGIFAVLVAQGIYGTAAELPDTIILDGELYHHDYRDRFEQLTSLIRPDEPRPGHEVVEYHVYDIVSQQPFLERFRTLEHTFDTTKHIRLVETHIADNVDQLMSHYDYFRKAGYEGAMARQLHLPYEHKRSDQLLKLKDFVDLEFKIVGVEEGRGKLKGHVGAFVCEVPVSDGVTTCAVKLAGDTSVLAQAWQQPDKWIGKMLTVKYQGRTATGSLRFPTGLRLREEV